MRSMEIDCHSCPAKERMCGDCMVTHLYSLAPPAPLVPRLDADEQAALDLFVRVGLVTVVDAADATLHTGEQRGGVDMRLRSAG